MAQSMARLVNFWNDQPARPAWHPDLHQQFVRLQRRFEQALEELGRGDLPVPGWPAGDQRGVQGQDDRGQVGRGIAVRQRAADRAAVPDLRVADLAGRVRQQRDGLGQQRGVLQVAVPGQRADRDVPGRVADVAQLAQPGHIDEHLGLGQPQLHQRQQRVAAGQELGLVAVLGGQRQRLVHRGGARGS